MKRDPKRRTCSLGSGTQNMGTRTLDPEPKIWIEGSGLKTQNQDLKSLLKAFVLYYILFLHVLHERDFSQVNVLYKLVLI